MNIVRVVNEGLTDFHDKWNSQEFIIPSGSEMMVPIDAAYLWAGDWDARDIDARRRFRTNEFRRLRTRYGVYDDETVWDERRPQIAVYTLDGTRLTTILDDPLGKTLGLPKSHNTDQRNLQAQINALETQLTALTKMQVQQAQPVPVAAEDAPAGPDPAETTDPAEDSQDAPTGAQPVTEPPVDEPKKIKVSN